MVSGVVVLQALTSEPVFAFFCQGRAAAGGAGALRGAAALYCFLNAHQQISVYVFARAELPSAELARYEEQQRYIARIVALYQSDPDNFSELFSLIQQARCCLDARAAVYCMHWLCSFAVVQPWSLWGTSGFAKLIRHMGTAALHVSCNT